MGSQESVKKRLHERRLSSISKQMLNSGSNNAKFKGSSSIMAGDGEILVGESGDDITIQNEAHGVNEDLLHAFFAEYREQWLKEDILRYTELSVGIAKEYCENTMDETET